MAKFELLHTKSGRLFFIALLFALMAGAGTILYLKSLERRIEEKYTPAKEQKSRVVVVITSYSIHYTKLYDIGQNREKHSCRG